MPLASRHSVVQYFSLPLDDAQFEEWATDQRTKLAGPATFGLLFCAPDAVPDAREILEILRIYAQVPVMLGCSAGGVIAESREIENEGGFCVALYHLPGTQAHALHLPEATLAGDDGAALQGALKGYREAVNAWMLFASSESFANDVWLDHWDHAAGAKPTVGGFAGAMGESASALFCDGTVHTGGAVALALEGDVTIDPLLSQGCRPVGSPWTITRAERNIIHQIGNRPILEVLRDTLEGMSQDEQRQARGNIFIGLVMDEYKASFGTGDFLVRNLAAIDPKTGAVAIATPTRTGQNLQFQIRDARTASVDLEELLKQRLAELAGSTIYGACLCDCIGRGSSLFGVPNHDVGIVQRLLPDLPLGGLFCNGEFAPVKGRTLLHGYAATLGLFVSKP
ncbi:MAG: FIST signal transduction protein [Opitutales bacterium]